MTHSDSTAMVSWRKTLVSGMVAVVVVGHLYDGWRDSAHWPFHSFHMFSTLSRSRSFTIGRLMGVDSHGQEFLLSEPAYSEPILIFHARLKFAHARAQKKNRCETLRKLSEEYIARYERHRLSGRHNGPQLAGVRLYEYAWTLTPTAANAGTPETKSLLFDSMLPCDDRQPMPDHDEPTAEGSL